MKRLLGYMQRGFVEFLNVAMGLPELHIYKYECVHTYVSFNSRINYTS
jgi:hypothetical protein